MEKNKKRTYTRREALKYGAKVGIGAAIWVTAGNFLGRGYKIGRDFYKEEIAPYVEKGRDIIDNGEKSKDFLWDRPKKFWTGLFKKKKPERNEEYKEKRNILKKDTKKISRRTFLTSFLKYGHEHPVGTGTAVGTTYGATKKAISGLGDYQKNKKIARLRDDNVELKERVGNLEGKLKELEEKGLVEKTTEALAILIGIFGITISTIAIKKQLTGFVIDNGQQIQTNFFAIILLFLSFLLLIIGIKEKIIGIKEKS